MPPRASRSRPLASAPFSFAEQKNAIRLIPGYRCIYRARPATPARALARRAYSLGPSGFDPSRKIYGAPRRVQSKVAVADLLATVPQIDQQAERRLHHWGLDS